MKRSSVVKDLWDLVLFSFERMSAEIHCMLL